MARTAMMDHERVGCRDEIATARYVATPAKRQVPGPPSSGAFEGGIGATSVLELAAQQADSGAQGKMIAWNTEDSWSSTRCRLPSPFLTASLIAAPEPLREARRGTVVWPDYGETSQQRQGVCRVEETGRQARSPQLAVVPLLSVRLLNSGRGRAGRRRRGGRRGPHS
ncbi:hypothetical protein Taro_009821 [Colocasia esculenta]|uniref:Uncharacterized protein n=1 Tax=Colocasia esculenta TaxID=4460 RepID=A0A843U1A9_COLES|nr:hypothetical protein [Colocasia esculenta]